MNLSRELHSTRYSAVFTHHWRQHWSMKSDTIPHIDSAGAILWSIER